MKQKMWKVPTRWLVRQSARNDRLKLRFF